MVCSQWRSEGGWLLGFRYEGIAALFEMHGVPKIKQKKIISSLQIMETETMLIRNPKGNDEKSNGQEN